MQEVAIFWFVVVWFLLGIIERAIILARGPLLIGPFLELIVIIIGLVMVLRSAPATFWHF